MQRSVLGRLTLTQGASLGLIVVVVVTIVIARLLPHSSADPLVHEGTAPVATSSIDAGAGTLPTAAPSGPLLHRPVAPITKAGAATPQSVAKKFGTAWLHHDGVTAAAWLHGVTPYTTDALAAQLAQTDPSNVPANRLTGAVTIVDDAVDSCGARVPTDTGTLVLTLQAVHGVWLVSAVDWDRA